MLLSDTPKLTGLGWRTAIFQNQNTATSKNRESKGMVSSITRVRILACQGPQSLFAGLSFLLDDAEKNKDRYFHDILIIGGLYADEKNAEIESLCRQIAGIHEFSAIHSTIDLDKKYQSKMISTAEYILAILTMIGGVNPDVVATVRNMQFFNDAILNCFRYSEKVVYGDGIGWIDTNSNRFARPILGSGYVQPDRIASILPIEGEPGAFSELPITFVSSGHYREVVEKASDTLRPDFLNIVPMDGMDRSSLVCLATLTESKHTSDVATEVEYYLRSIEYSRVDRSSTILVKGHPRERYEQSRILVERLRTEGYQAHSSPRLAVWPSESLAFLLNFSHLVSLNSSSCASWAILGANVLFSVGTSPNLNRSHLANPDRFGIYSFELFLQTVRALLGKNFSLTHNAVTRHFESFKGEWSGVALSAANAGQFSELIESVEISSRSFAPSHRNSRESIGDSLAGSKKPDRFEDVLAMNMAVDQKITLIRDILEKEVVPVKNALHRESKSSHRGNGRMSRNSQRCYGLSGVQRRLIGMILKMCTKFRRKLQK